MLTSARNAILIYKCIRIHEFVDSNQFVVSNRLAKTKLSKLFKLLSVSSRSASRRRGTNFRNLPAIHPAEAGFIICSHSIFAFARSRGQIMKKPLRSGPRDAQKGARQPLFFERFTEIIILKKSIRVALKLSSILLTPIASSKLRLFLYFSQIKNRLRGVPTSSPTLWGFIVQSRVFLHSSQKIFHKEPHKEEITCSAIPKE